MSTWLKLLALEVREVDELVEPQEKVREGEMVVGTLSEDMRKLYSLWKSLEKAAELLTVELKYGKATDEERGKLAEMRAKAQALGMLFWIGALDELQLWSHPEQCALRAGWQIVEYQAGPTDFLRHLFGGLS